MNSADSIVIAGSVAQRPGIGGHTWQFLQYILGFQHLGWRVLFLDRLEPGMCTDGYGAQVPPEESIQLGYLRRVMADFGLGDNYALLYDGEVFAGLSRAEVKQRLGESAFLLNVMGFLNDPDLLGAARLRVFLDTDPGYAQMWHALGLANMFHSHDRYVTIAENIGRPDCPIPTCDTDWITWRQPVVLDQWPVCPPVAGSPFTAVGVWRGPYDRLEYSGHSYGQRAHEFRKFFSLPRLTDARFELAFDIDASDAADIEDIQAHGWNLIPPSTVSATPQAYRAFIQASRAEFMIARGMYTQARCGWFSERSACYLATGRPVLATDTGLDALLPVGDGLVTFSTIEEAVEGVNAIEANYEHHARSARELAESYFDSDAALLALAERVTAVRAQSRRSR
jgi:hypothetical protein